MAKCPRPLAGIIEILTLYPATFAIYLWEIEENRLTHFVNVPRHI